MSFRKAVSRMKVPEQRHPERQSRLAVRGSYSRNLSPNHSLSRRRTSSTSGVYSRSPSHSPNFRSKQAPNQHHQHHNAMTIPVVAPQILYNKPKQFVLRRTESSSSYEDGDDELEESDGGSTGTGHAYNIIHSNMAAGSSTTNGGKLVPNRKSFDKEFFSFSDLDYELPAEVREVLRQEGLAERTVEDCLKDGQLWHRRALALRRFQSAKMTVSSSKKVVSSLPPIGPGPAGLDKQGQSQQDRASAGTGSSTDPDEAGGTLPQIDLKEGKDGKSKKKMLTPREEAMEGLTEEEDMRWRAEQQQERIWMPLNFTYPRLVIISSKVPWSQALMNSVRRDLGVLALVYDFDAWSFDDITDQCKKAIHAYHRLCRVQSILLLCRGGKGFFYMLRNYVMTPQKLSRTRYKHARKFWHSLGDMVSKVEPDQAKIHLIGADLESNNQGQQLIRAMLKLMSPARLDLETPNENSPMGHEVIGQYFDLRKFLLWRSRRESQLGVVQQGEGAVAAGPARGRSWSSIEAEVERREKIQNILHSPRPQEEEEVDRKARIQSLLGSRSGKDTQGSRGPCFV